MKKSTLLLLISTALFFTSTLVLLYLNYLKQSPTSTPTTGVIPTDTPIPTVDPTADWKTISTSSYELKYPQEIEAKLAEASNIFLTKAGLTQKTGTELYDGISLHFELREIPGIPLQYAKNIIANSQQNFESTVTQSPKPVTINGYSGVDFILETLNRVHYYVLQGSNNLLMIISDSTVDPTNQGYTTIVSQILSTFKFTDQKEESALDVAKKYLDAYVSQDWTTAKKYSSDSNFDEKIAQSYAFVKYTITGQKADTKANYYHIYVSFTDKNGEVNNKAPYSSAPLEVLMVKDNNGEWKALTWYFYP